MGWHREESDRRFQREKVIADSIIDGLTAARVRAAAAADKAKAGAASAAALEAMVAEAEAAEEALAAKRELAAAARKQSKEKQLQECTPTELARRAEQREHQRRRQRT